MQITLIENLDVGEVNVYGVEGMCKGDARKG